MIFTVVCPFLDNLTELLIPDLIDIIIWITLKLIHQFYISPQYVTDLTYQCTSCVGDISPTYKWFDIRNHKPQSQWTSTVNDEIILFLLVLSFSKPQKILALIAENTCSPFSACWLLALRPCTHYVNSRSSPCPLVIHLWIRSISECQDHK